MEDISCITPSQWQSNKRQALFTHVHIVHTSNIFFRHPSQTSVVYRGFRVGYDARGWSGNPKWWYYYICVWKPKRYIGLWACKSHFRLNHFTWIFTEIDTFKIMLLFLHFRPFKDIFCGFPLMLHMQQHHGFPHGLLDLECLWQKLKWSSIIPKRTDSKAKRTPLWPLRV